MRKTNKLYEVLKRFLTTAICLCIILSIAFTSRQNGKSVKCGDNADTATIVYLDNGTTVINTTSIASDLRGYGGAVPMKVYISENRIDSIRILPNNETPEFLEAVREEVLDKYIGLGVDKAWSANVEALSGATMSSECVKGTLHRALALFARKTAEDSEAKPLVAVKMAAACIVALMAALLPLYVRSKRYRLLQLFLNVVVLGFYCGTFVSYSSLTGIISAPGQLLDPSYLTANIALLLLAFIALFYPLFGKKGHYCAWCCPLGSMQDLANKAGHRRQWHIPAQWVHRLTIMRRILWAVLMLLTWTGVTFAWMDYELFTAFLWQAASWVMLAFLVLCVVLSLFVKRPYCRFVCPTGTLLKI
ncbi:MAG: 4Fe-4S binding protein [Bacteroidales bacterium]|nr:4Fe-4S binding protein [Bacteroidales bacterium]MCM1147117.1 4Fe-4S binding protein [Bacteroidales bacterium]MCM1205749.1 4Fe-4S binding protein [Bacillota bacterium]MCM1511140.1 4Fe-4S binding protein [Clostridium sp.]